MDKVPHRSTWKPFIAQGAVIVFSLVGIAMGAGAVIQGVEAMTLAFHARHIDWMSPDLHVATLGLLYGMGLVVGGVSCWFMHHADAWQRLAMLPWWPICLLFMWRRLPSERKWNMQRRRDRQPRGA